MFSRPITSQSEAIKSPGTGSWVFLAREGLRLLLIAHVHPIGASVKARVRIPFKSGSLQLLFTLPGINPNLAMDGSTEEKA